jgi:hypothetical protein
LTLPRVSVEEVGVRVQPCHDEPRVIGTGTHGDSEMKGEDDDGSGATVTLQLGTQADGAAVRVQLKAEEPDSRKRENVSVKRAPESNDKQAPATGEPKANDSQSPDSNEKQAASTGSSLLDTNDVRRAHEKWVASPRYCIPTIIKYSAAADTSLTWQKRMDAIRCDTSVDILAVCLVLFTGHHCAV